MASAVQLLNDAMGLRKMAMVLWIVCCFYAADADAELTIEVASALSHMDTDVKNAQTTLDLCEVACSYDPSLPICEFVGFLAGAVTVAKTVNQIQMLVAQGMHDAISDDLDIMEGDYLRIVEIIQFFGNGSIIQVDGRCSTDDGNCLPVMTNCSAMYSNGHHYIATASDAMQNLQCDECANAGSFNPVSTNRFRLSCEPDRRRLFEIGNSADDRLQSSAAYTSRKWICGLATVVPLGFHRMHLQYVALVSAAGVLTSSLLTGCHEQVDTYFYNCRWMGMVSGQGSCTCGPIDKSRCNCLTRAKEGMDSALTQLSYLYDCLCIANTPNHCDDTSVNMYADQIKEYLLIAEIALARTAKMTLDADNTSHPSGYEQPVYDCPKNLNRVISDPGDLVELKDNLVELPENWPESEWDNSQLTHTFGQNAEALSRFQSSLMYMKSLTLADGQILVDVVRFCLFMLIFLQLASTRTYEEADNAKNDAEMYKKQLEPKSTTNSATNRTVLLTGEQTGRWAIEKSSPGSSFAMVWYGQFYAVLDVIHRKRCFPIILIAFCGLSSK